jgi:hypothetical protein
MRSRVLYTALASTSLFLALGAVATAQRRGPRPGADGGTVAADASAAVSDAGATRSDAGAGLARADGGTGPARADGGPTRSDAGAGPARADGGAGSAMAGGAPVADGGAAVTSGPNAFDLPMQQRGNGAVTHYPIPEQLARNDVPVFAQVRSSAPIDHVSLFFRSQGASRYRELRLTTMGRELGLANGYGAQVPCEDAFPPSIEYYINAVDTSGEVIGHAGTAVQPLRVPIVTARTRDIIPTLPGQAPPRNCGSLAGMASQPTARDAGVEQRGTADLGEPCARDNECRRGLRCGLARTCVFVSAP